MVQRLEVELAGLADVLEHDVVVLAALGGVGVHDVGDGAVQLGQLRLGGVLLGLRGLDLGGQLLALGQQRLALLALGPADLLAEQLLLAPQRVRPGDGGTSAFVRGQQRVDHRLVLTARSLRRTDGFGVLAHCLQVDHEG